MYKDTHEVIIYNAQTTENRLNTNSEMNELWHIQTLFCYQLQRAYIDMGKYESVKAVYFKNFNYIHIYRKMQYIVKLWDIFSSPYFYFINFLVDGSIFIIKKN